ncbi:WD-REPEATS-REGION domain-containing protein [Mycena venus]|uniref:WD-REPEATS-REGION domain-containing protein n=1 Tax=Mycena venus TaxID=2733690 RepID=A0A8H6Y4W1_9AGAR|nr:WD-REPEATS-REGION domain-containing protein [Mycena venus]
MALPPAASDSNHQALVCFKPSNHALLLAPPQRRPRGPGLTISQISNHIGNALEPVINSLFRLVGPEHWRSRIEDLFGDDDGRDKALDELHRKIHNPNCSSGRLKPLEGHCHELLKLARPESTTVRTQLITFQILVTMITRYPGIRCTLRADKDLKKASATDPFLSSVWKRPYHSGGAAWSFYRDFAVFCISDNAFEFTQLLEAEPPGDRSCLTLENLSEKVLVEKLLGHARDGPEFHLSRLCAIRYLAGILELPSFWRRFPSEPCAERDRQRFLDVLSELCRTILQLLEDVGRDAADMSVDSSPSMDAGRMAVEVLCCSVLNGLLRLRDLNNLPPRRPTSLSQIVSTLLSDRKRFDRAFEPASRVKAMFDSPRSSPTDDEDECFPPVSARPTVQQLTVLLRRRLLCLPVQNIWTKLVVLRRLHHLWPQNKQKVLVSPPRLDIQALASSVLRGREIITKRKAEKQADRFIFDVIAKQADEYDVAVKISLDMSQTGYTFAEDAIMLCTLVAEREVDEENLRIFVAEMLVLANRAYGQACSMNEQFTTIQRDVPQEQLLETPNGILQYPAELIKQVSRGSVPPDGSVTPLENAQNDLMSLAACVGTFVDWWGAVKMKLNSLHSSTRLIKLDGSNPLRERAVLERWVGLRDQYTQYQNTVREVYS